MCAHFRRDLDAALTVIGAALITGCSPSRINLPSNRPCGANVFRLIKDKPEVELKWFDRKIAFLTTPVKRLGVLGWDHTGCHVEGTGIIARDAQYSTDGFWTLDVHITRLEEPVNRQVLDRGAIRLELRPGTASNLLATREPLKKGMMVWFTGDLLTDHDGAFLEVHPEVPLRVIPSRDGGK
jgi:hypothetical protein